MREYEFIYIVQPDVEPERLDEIHARVESTINGGQGQVLLRDDWGKRKLAYEIQKFQKGHYFLVEMLGDGKFIAAVERDMRLDPDVLRYLTVLVAAEVKDVPARIERAKREAAERAERRAERERLDRERQDRERQDRERLDREREERERAETAAREEAAAVAEVAPAAAEAGGGEAAGLEGSSDAAEAERAAAAETPADAEKE